MQDYIDDIIGTLSSHVPGVLGALIVLIVGWMVAKGVRSLVQKLLSKSELDNRLFRGKTPNGASPEKFIGSIVYYLVLVIVLMIVLELLGVHNVLDPLKNMVNEFFSYIPNIVAGGVIAFAGYLIATIASEVIGFGGNVLEDFSNKMGLKENMDLAGIIKKVVFLIVFVPVLIVALDTLKLNAISEPAKEVLGTFMSAIPNIFLAAIIIGVFYFVGKFVTTFLHDILKGLGIDDYNQKLGLTNIIGEETSLSALTSKIAFFFLMFSGVITAMNKLGFDQLSALLNNLMEVSGQIFFGMVILAVGNWISNIAYNALSKSEDNHFMATLARVATLGLFLAIALRTMGIANDIVNLAFGLTLGAVAVAFALSFGLGGREAAGKHMEHFLRKLRKEE